MLPSPRIGWYGDMSEQAVPTVVIADDDAAVRSALADLISSQDELALDGIGTTGEEAAELCAIHHPTLAIVDVMMPGGGEAAITAIHQVSPQTAVVVYTARSDRRTRTRMLEAGAVGVITKGGGLDVADELLIVARSTPDGGAAPDAT